MRARPIARWTVLAALAGALAAGAEAADRSIEPGAYRVHRHVRHVRVRDCVDDRAAIKPTKYVRRCAIVSTVPWDSGLRLQWAY